MSKPKQWVRAVFAEECRLSSLLLRFSNPELFSESPWFPPALFIIYRLVVSSCCVIFTVESIYNNPSYLWLLQFDNWSISSVCLYFILSTSLLIYCTIKTWRENNTKEKNTEGAKHDKRAEKSYWAEDGEYDERELLWHEDDETFLQDPEEDKLSYYHKTVWLLQGIAGNSVLIVVLCYVILEDQVKPLVLATYLSFTVFLFADAVFCFAPIRLTHVVYSYLFTLLYVIVIVVYYIAVVDRQVSELPRFVNRIQDSFSSIVVFLILIVGQPLFQTLYFGVHKLNTFVYITYYGY